jgi:hypothetical protein
LGDVGGAERGGLDDCVVGEVVGIVVPERIIRIQAVCQGMRWKAESRKGKIMS